MKERPIRFSDTEVRAILEGRKTQTRRIAKLPFGFSWDNEAEGLITDWKCVLHLEEIKCPHGTVGDRLWVREAFCPKFEDGRPVYNADGNLDYTCCYYRADGVDVRLCDGDGFGVFTKSGLEASPWTPSIHMPRWASRITLEITGVRVERLHEISEKDAQAEGVSDGYIDQHGDSRFCGHYENFAKLWQSINGPESWAANPWVWVIEFRRITV